MQKKGKRYKNCKKNKILLTIFVILITLSMGYILYYLYDKYKLKDDLDILSDIVIDENLITDTKTKRMLQLEELQKQNNDIIGWLEIEGTNINCPVLQTTDNEYYLTHNYKKEEASTGSLFLDKDFDINRGSSNYLIYGHRNKKGLMFEDLIKYSKEDFYKEHKRVNFTTNKDDSVYEVLSVFYSRVYYKNEKDVFRYYYFVNASSEEEYNEFVNSAKRDSIYDTGVTAQYGDQLLTLSTCEYSQDDGRFAVVFKKVEMENKN